MLVFSNPGLIDLDAVRILGVSVKRAGAFGRFGTGLKFAIATVLRNGGSVTLWRGLERHEFGVEETEIRGEKFQVVTLDGVRMGITTQLGRDWKPWMVLRELGCNALDEGGKFGEGGEFSDNPDKEDSTVVVVNWPDLDVAYQQRDELFLPADKPILHKTDALRILLGPSAHIFYRGVRVYKLEKPSLFTYDLLEEQYLTEDRTLMGSYSADRIIRDAMLTIPVREIASQTLTAESSYYEHGINFADCSYGLKPSRPWLDAAIEARENSLRNDSARKVLLKYTRSAAEETSFYGGSYRRAVDDVFQYAIDLLKELGLEFSADQKFVLVEEMPVAGMMTMLEEGRIYFVAELNQLPAREVAIELALRWAETKVDGFSQDSMAKLLVPFIVGRSANLKHDEQLIEEDAAVAEEV